MPEFHKLSREEVEARAPGQKPPSQRALIREQYRRFLEDIEPGEGGEVTLDEGDNRLTIRNRLKTAADELGKNLVFIRTRENLVRFRMGDGAQAQAGEELLDRTPQEGASPEVPSPPVAEITSETTQEEPKPTRARRRKTVAAE